MTPEEFITAYRDAIGDSERARLIVELVASSREPSGWERYQREALERMRVERDAAERDRRDAEALLREAAAKVVHLEKRIAEVYAFTVPELEKRLAAMTEAAARNLVRGAEEEREACAKLTEEMAPPLSAAEYGVNGALRGAARAIRARGDTGTAPAPPPTTVVSADGIVWCTRCRSQIQSGEVHTCPR